MTMQAQQLRTLFISHADPADVQAAMDLLRAGKPLTIAESGTVAYASIANLRLIQVGPLLFDGERYTQSLYVSAS